MTSFLRNSAIFSDELFLGRSYGGLFLGSSGSCGGLFISNGAGDIFLHSDAGDIFLGGALFFAARGNLT
ncbi:hypothetical protein [Oryza sativa Japonica Group]|uniref:Uncharacterized protein n=2 Tax=Oryza sativa subsp. japonica TaxID=39947 RepID=Q5JM13_ORYSJ|nr:hypothetical protein [Oryza sativa Japonica Group]BAD87645.1 hypothetical protein [Oryza sativa Japonica Group]